ncbi:S-adenosylmethionine mitochondrial carrier protein isoform X2 [Poeciliopsis prolifica]|uniref:S-adenosylmethionine mitochondrial carrier protein isoform X2 n=1 Tax=Poeciliopsis prolifica TaxID=188132 RepID=UPI002413B187|nr:S-adenosylmethionine mitochondrial carrier protein isoform X2 [Poeciliopsis prolifica]
MERRQFVASLVAGGCAGMCVDLTLFPLDTIKTRLQSQQGFHKAGGFKGIYAGVPSAAVGSFPNAAAFFVTYECAKSLLGASGAFAAPRAAPVSHMLAASLGEITPPWRGWDQPAGICATLGPQGEAGRRVGGRLRESLREIHSLFAGVSTPMQDKWGSQVARYTVGLMTFCRPASRRTCVVSPVCSCLLAGQVALSLKRSLPSTPRFTASCHVAMDPGRVACLIRVPTEVVKQRTQASPSSTTYSMLLATLREEGVRGLYRGYGSTVLREIPFSLVQFPLWEYLKTLWSKRQGHTLHSWQSAVCGAFAGAVAAFVTTPLDVAKTRIMLAKAVCRQRPEDGLHQRGRLHLPGSVRKGPPHVTIAGLQGATSHPTADPRSLGNATSSVPGPCSPGRCIPGG